MKELPYFLSLLKNNTLLWTITTTNSITNINLEGTIHGYWSNQCLELRDYSLNKGEKFKNIRITDNESYMMIDFYTDSDKYITNTEYYFGEVVMNPLFINNAKTNSSQKTLGKFDMGLEIPIDVEITNYGEVYGNVIGITIYNQK